MPILITLLFLLGSPEGKAAAIEIQPGATSVTIECKDIAPSTNPLDRLQGRDQNSYRRVVCRHKRAALLARVEKWKQVCTAPPKYRNGTKHRFDGGDGGKFSIVRTRSGECTETL